ncbi:C3 and PZP-like, alpha-2-macroglobulin domain containing 8 [Chamberlinius hualienensis]
MKFLLQAAINLLIIAVNCQQDCNESKLKAYILTAPSVFDSGSTEKICMTFVGIYSNGKVSFKLEDSGKVVAKDLVNINKGESQCVQLSVPVIRAKTAVLSVSGRFINGYSFSNKSTVNIRKTADIVLIQTDKVVYKTSQLVRIRLLHLTSDLLPTSKKITLVTIEDPSKTRVSQFTDPQSQSYIYNLAYKLSDRPKIGNWTINVEDEDKTRTSKVFVVQDYILPKFNVEITSPKSVTPSFKSIEYKICAEYMYEEPVIGKVTTYVTFVSTKANVKSMSSQSYEATIDGCTKITVTRNNFNFGGKDISHFDSVKFNAEVTETGTGHKKSSTVTKQLRSPINLFYISAPFFKPGLPYIGKMYLEDTDGNPVEGETIWIEIVFISRLRPNGYKPTTNKIVSNKGGIALFTIPAQDELAQKFQIKISTNNYPQQQYHYFGLIKPSGVVMPKAIIETIRPWYSPSHSFISIYGPTKALRCNNKAYFEVHMTKSTVSHLQSENIIIHYQVMSRNNIIIQSSVSIKKSQLIQAKSSMQFEISFNIEPTMSPKLEILVYYVTLKREIVSDSEAFIVEKCFEHKPEMNFTKTKVTPGSKTTINLKADPNSMCSIYMTDKSAQLHQGSQFNPYKIFYIINRTPIICPAEEDFTPCKQKDPQLGNFARNLNILQSRAAFDAAGLMTMSDLGIELNPCQPDQVINGGGRLQSAGLNDVLSDTINYEDLIDVYDYKSIPEVDVRNFFPETWLWEIVPINQMGQATLERTVPHSMTKWIGNAFCISKTAGLGVSPLTSIISYQHVSMFLDLPDSATQGETVTATVTIHSYFPRCFPIQLTMLSNEKFGLTAGSNVVQLCICGKKPHFYKYHIQVKAAGKINVNVTLSSLPSTNSKVCAGQPTSEVWAHDSISKPITVNVAAIPKESTHSDWICAKGKSTTVKLNLPIPATAIRTLPIQTRALVTGDVMAPSIIYMNALVYLPGGCAEQTMKSFGPLVYMVSYLQKTKQLTIGVKNQAIQRIKKGYSNELRWKLSDGSYECWGRKNIGGSVWLTAFVIKSFVAAKNLVYIDPNIISSGINFILKKQNRDGCFYENDQHKSHHKEIKGGIGQGENSIYALTLYVTIALLESSAANNNVVKNVFNCIAKDTYPSTYRRAMKAYALALAGKTTEAETLITNLEKNSNKQGTSTYWTSGSKEVTIETTAYVLLAIATLRTKHIQLGSQIARWLISQRNGHGGFTSTQDTVIGIQALEMFTSQVAQKSTDMTVKIKTDNSQQLVTVHGNNRLATKNIPINGNTVDVETTGSGCVLVQFTTTYYSGGNNIAKSFYIDVTVKPNAGSTDKITKKTLHICVKYQAGSEKSNMAIVDIAFPTGYEADNQFNNLKNLGINLGNWESRKCGVILYFGFISQKLTCFDLVITETSKVENRVRSIIKVYDYYQPELESSLEYAV